MKEVITNGINVTILQESELDYISLTDIARYKNNNESRDVVKNWMRTRSTIEFLGIWEKINNVNFKEVEFDLFKNESGSNSFVLTPRKWIESTNAIGLIVKPGRYRGGTYAHIAFAPFLL